jgi:putative transposase
MPRKRRCELAGVPHHVIQRGNNRMTLLRQYEDYEFFLRLLVHATTHYGTAVNGYTLMENHLHLIMTPGVCGAIGRVMQVAGSRYAQYFNRRYERTGSLFEGRYRMSVVDTDDYWFTCMRYVELNPVRAGMVKRADEYSWSSYSANALGVPDRVVTPHALYLALGPTPEQRQSRWKAMCARELDVRELAAIRYSIHFGERFTPAETLASESQAPDEA